MYNTVNVINMLYVIYESCKENKSKEFSSQEKTFFSISFILFLHKMMRDHKIYCGNHLMMYVSQIIMLSATKRNEIVPCAETRLDLETVIQSEVSQKEKNKYHIISLTCGI